MDKALELDLFAAPKVSLGPCQLNLLLVGFTWIRQLLLQSFFFTLVQKKQKDFNISLKARNNFDFGHTLKTALVQILYGVKK